MNVKTNDLVELQVDAAPGQIVLVKPLEVENLNGQVVKPELLRYNPEAIAAHYKKKPLEVLGRILKVIFPSVSFALGVWWDKKRGVSDRNEPKRAVQLKELLTKLGPAYIKIGQALSTRPDLVSPAYLEELTRLQDQIPPFANEIAYQFIEEELGDRPENIYAELSPEPIAAASLGQVYKGKLKTGETVAVKVQRPDLQATIAVDLYILRRMATWANNNIKRLRSDLVAILDEFGERIFEEMDYINEGENAERFAKLYGHLKDVYVPKIYWQYTHRRVLTMEWIVGTKLTQVDAIRAQGIDARYIIEVGVQCSLRQLLEHGFFHADPHPGNLLATPDGQLAYLDFGMMSEIKPYQRYGLIEAVVHMVNRDFEGLARDYVKLDFLTPETDLVPIIPALAQIFGNALGASVAELNFKSITDQLSALMYEYPFRVPAYYALIIRSLVTLEGIAIYIDPNFKVLSEAYPYISKRLLTDPAPELRESLRDLLFKDGRFRWNRLENLLKNARSSDEYNLNQVLDETLEFLSSERGALIRNNLIDELAKSIDALSKDALNSVTNNVRDRLFNNPWAKPIAMAIMPVPAASTEQEQTLEHIKRIWGILQETRGFDATKVSSQIPQLLSNPGVQQIGRQVAGRLTSKVVARLIRETLVKGETNGVAKTAVIVKT